MLFFMIFFKVSAIHCALIFLAEKHELSHDLTFFILLCDVINKYLVLLVTKVMVVHKREKKDSISTAREDQQHHLHRCNSSSFLPFYTQVWDCNDQVGSFFCSNTCEEQKSVMKMMLDEQWKVLFKINSKKTA